MIFRKDTKQKLGENNNVNCVCEMISTSSVRVKYSINVAIITINHFCFTGLHF